MSRPEGAALGEGETELLVFPNGRHDDQADAFAYAALQVAHTPTHSAADLAEALDTPELIQACEWRNQAVRPRSCR